MRHPRPGPAAHRPRPGVHRPAQRVRAYDPATERNQVFGPADRIEVLVEIGKQFAGTKGGRPLWPGDIPRTSSDASAGG